ncbi:MAG: alpha/beta hydrolase [Candidatus Omnitrophica bacterium]|nr:alpha/beta hydrolase [Candidatus Omnitrophota bacterium]
MPLLALVAVFLAFFLFVRYLEKTALFYPSQDMHASPADAGLAFEDVWFRAEDGVKLHGWFIPGDNARRNMLYFHGNAGNISDRVEKMAFFRSLGFNVFVFDYRGYGLSEGRPDETGIFRDGRAAFDHIASRADVGRLPTVLYGASVGGAVSIDVASLRRPAALITEATFTNAKDVARIYYPFVPGFMISLKFESDRKITAISCPKLMLHSRTDEIIPYRLGRRLFEKAAEPKEFLEVRGGHNDNVFQSMDMVREAMARFLGKYGL